MKEPYTGDWCTADHLQRDRLDDIRNEIPAEERIAETADLFKVFGDATRVKILYALFEQELCVCAIAELLGMTQPAISYQLRVLKQSKLVRNRREGKSIYYSLADDYVKTILGMAKEHLEE